MAWSELAFESKRSQTQEPQTFSNASDRTRLSGTAIKAFRKVVARWGVSNTDAAALLGVSLSTWERIKRGERMEALTQDQLTRVSALVGIFKGLHLLIANDAADKWPQRLNSGPLFENRSPLDAMIAGGIPRMIEVRRYIDAVRGGL